MSSVKSGVLIVGVVGGVGSYFGVGAEIVFSFKNIGRFSPGEFVGYPQGLFVFVGVQESITGVENGEGSGIGFGDFEKGGKWLRVCESMEE